jgi:hypothetical protein
LSKIKNLNMKKLKSFIITLLVFIAVTVLGIFLIEAKLLELFFLGIGLLAILALFIVIWYIIHSEFFNK